MAGPTRAEMVLDQLSVIRADYNRILTKKRSTCLDCNGSGVHVADKQDETDSVVTCARCQGAGFEELAEYDPEFVPEELKPFITGFKTGGGGRILPEVRNKDKAAAEIMKALSNGWSSAFPRDAFGADAPGQVEETPTTDKESIIKAYERIAAAADPATAMGALREISKLRGYITEENDEIDTVPMTAVDLQKALASHIESGKNNAPTGS